MEVLNSGMDKIKNIATKKNVVIILFITIFFIGVSVYVYNNYVIPQVNPDYVPNKEYLNKNKGEGEQVGNKNAELYFFYVTWCPHCKTAQPIWNQLKENIGNNPINGYTIDFISIDCDKDTAMAEQYNVESYPTIKLNENGNIVDYDAKPEVSTLKQFLKTSLN